MNRANKFLTLFSLSLLFGSIAYTIFVYAEVHRNTAPFDRGIYLDLLLKLRVDHRLLGMRDYFSLEDDEAVAVLTHDVDVVFKGLKVLVEVERGLDVRSTVLVRLDADYLTLNLAFLQGLERDGWEIGFHYDCLSRTQNMSEALKLFEAQLVFFRSYFNVSSISYHGDGYDLKTVNSALFWENVEWVHGLGLHERVEVGGQYVSDTNHILSIPEKFEGLVVVNFHSDWW